MSSITSVEYKGNTGPSPLVQLSRNIKKLVLFDADEAPSPELSFDTLEHLTIEGNGSIVGPMREEGEEDWLCYCGLPSHGYRRNGDRISAPEEEVYLVFVSADRVAYNSRWERCDQGNSKFPEDYQNRFDKWVL